MNGRDKRRKRAERGRNMRTIGGARDPWGGMCPNRCGGRGPHFVPPSLGDAGFFVCTPALRLSQQIVAFATDRLGVDLSPWQKAYIERVYDGRP